MNYYATIFLQPKHRKERKTFQNIENDDKIDKERINNVEYYKTIYNSHYSSPEDKYEAWLTNEGFHKITLKNMRVKTRDSQVFFLFYSGSVCSIVTTHPHYQSANCNKAKWLAKKNRRFFKFPLNWSHPLEQP